MMDDTPLSLWRLAADLTVEDAAILVAGGDPSEVDRANPMADWEAEPVWKKRTTGHPGFIPAFSALKAAVLSGQIPAHFHYTGVPVFDQAEFPVDKFHIVSREVLSNYLDIRESPIENPHGKIAIFDEPDWSETFLKVEDLKAWLRSRGFTSGFFFNADQPNPDEFLDRSHEHFAPELALAVSAWRALAEKQRFPRGPKAAIEAWIEGNPQEWQDDDPLSNEAKKRICTLVNWKRSGGANPTGG
jgi:hypothetical protein